jgi:copper(I)-binding protein
MTEENPMRRAALLLLFVLSMTSPSFAHEYKVQDLTIGHPWSRATPGGAKVGVVYITLINDGKTADRLIKVSTPVAASASIHSSVQDGDIMRMREVEGIEIPAGKEIELKPGGLHIMLMGLTRPLKDGEMFPLTLTFAKAGEVALEAMVADQ